MSAASGDRPSTRERGDLPAGVRIVEVGPRDGLQNESRHVSTANKIAFVDALTDAGHGHIEVTSMVRPDRVPQLADAEDVFRGIRKKAGVRYTVLVPNALGLDRALAVGARSVAVFTAATESFSTRNTGMTISESLAAIEEVSRRAIREELAVRAYISTSFVCPYDGPVDPAAVISVLSRLRDLGLDTFSLGDTVGKALPDNVDRLLDVIEAQCPSPSARPLEGLALHLHDTLGHALENVRVGLRRGIETFDCSAGGLGGCPFAPGATGNLATESLIEMLDAMGIETGIDLLAQRNASEALLKEVRDEV